MSMSVPPAGGSRDAGIPKSISAAELTKNRKSATLTRTRKRPSQDVEPIEPAEVEGPPGLPRRGVGIGYIVLGLIGFGASLALLLERNMIMNDPTYVPSCSINPLLSCSDMIKSEFGRVFGFPNPWLGVFGFPIMVLIGVVFLTKIPIPKWGRWVIQAGVTFGIVFVHFLIWVSLFNLGRLCPYCLVVWAVMIPMFWFATLDNVLAKAFPLPQGVYRVFAGLRDFSFLVPVIWYIVIGAAILIRFWKFWTTGTL